jgi:hypothetical protein
MRHSPRGLGHFGTCEASERRLSGLFFQTHEHPFKVCECVGEVGVHRCRVLMGLSNASKHPRVFLERKADRLQHTYEFVW